MKQTGKGITKGKKPKFTQAEALDILAAALITIDELGIETYLEERTQGVLIYLPHVSIIGGNFIYGAAAE